MQIGLITVDGRQIGIVTQSTYTPDLTTPALGGEDMPMPAMRGDSAEDAGGHTRLGHRRGHFTGVKEPEHHVRLGHKRGFHPKGAGSPDAGTGAAPASGRQAMDPMAPAGTGITDAAKTTIRSKSGKTFQVADWAAPNFQHFIDSYEAAGGVLGPNTGTLGTRPGNRSYHPLARAMDINQVGRGQRAGGVTLPREIEDRLAEEAGLYPGSRFGDIGHFEARNKAHALEVQRSWGQGTAEPSGARPSGSAVRGSWFSDTSTATGLSAATTPGIALPSREGLGKMHEVTGPSGQKVMLPQIDIGPAKWTGRGIDISKAALAKLGYTEKNFPTDASFSHRRADEAAAKAKTETAKPPEDL